MVVSFAALDSTSLSAVSTVAPARSAEPVVAFMVAPSLSMPRWPSRRLPAARCRSHASDLGVKLYDHLFHLFAKHSDQPGEYRGTNYPIRSTPVSKRTAMTNA